MTTTMDKAMRDDVVTRLRKAAEYPYSGIFRPLFKDAADCIESSPTLPGESGMRDKTIEECAEVADAIALLYQRKNCAWDSGYTQAAERIAVELRALSQSSKPPPPAVPSEQEMREILIKQLRSEIAEIYGEDIEEMEGVLNLIRIGAVISIHSKTALAFGHELARRMVKP